MTLCSKLLVTATLLCIFFVSYSFVPLHDTRYKPNQHQLKHIKRILTQYKSACSPALFNTPPSGESENPPKTLTPEMIAEMIEVSFIQSCIQLASGYIDVLKLFIAAVKSGYEADLSLDQLSKLVEECPVNSANRELMKEEKELRREWMMVVYEMMKSLETNGQSLQDNKNNGGVVESRVSQVVSAILDVRKQLESEEEQSGGKQDAEVAAASLTVAETFSRSEKLTQMDKECDGPMEKAFLMNDVGVGVLTCRVLQEEKACTESSNSGGGTGGEVPRPPIPGTG